MHLPILKTATLLALAVCSTLALAIDPPARVGRVALTQGQVSVKSAGEATNAALVNWPVTSNQTISTAPGARTELRIGSTAIRLDGDSALEVLQLDDDQLRLRLQYGSASIRVVNEELAGSFELTTPQARVLLQGPGRLRVDAERVRDTSSIRVFDGVATVEGGGERLTVRSGRSAEVQGLDLRMTQAVTDAFDEWALVRDRESEAVRATRYVPAEMTGVEDLDRHGSWRDDSEYGALWLPSVASTWVPYRDGRWTWIAPWGWTWVDNAPWGYAPFHYGRWVHVHNRWAWAPGRLESRPVWAPALVGWVGGAGWSIHAGSSLAQGWYPLSPYDRFVPGYRLSDTHLRRLNAHDGKRDGRRDGAHDYRQRGLTVVPQDRFGQRGEVVVRHEARLTPLANWQGTPGAQPPVPRGWRERNQDDARRLDGRDGRDGSDNRRERRYNDGDGRPDGRRDGNDGWRRDAQRGAAQPAPGVQAQPGTITTAPPPVPQPPQAGFVRQPGLITTSPAPGGGRDWRGRDGRDGRDALEDGPRQRRFGGRDDAATGAPAAVAPPQPAPQPFTQRGGAGGAMEAAAARAQAQAQAHMQRQSETAVAPPPRAMPSPPPAPAAAPPQVSPAPREAPARRGGDGPRQRDGLRQMER
ncbi:DUF6600 domain-containing protein [Massilia sp. CMS3.1]|uniref:DUF6600 domain-containing protein n=1 Tax=Massilia sp. CMS3.1 TaxID=3373083 RepID=UPI003EE74301